MVFTVENKNIDNKKYQLYVDKTFGFVLQNATDGYTQEFKMAATVVKDYIVTTGSTQYAGMYYADATIQYLGTIYSVMIYSTTSNRPAYPVVLGNTSVRIYSLVAST